MSKSPSFNSQVLDAAVTTSDTSISHALGRVPLEAFILNRTTSGNVFRGSVAWTNTAINLKASAATTVRLLLI